MSPENYMVNVASGRLRVKRAQVDSFSPNGLKLSTGEEIEADVVYAAETNLLRIQSISIPMNEKPLF